MLVCRPSNNLVISWIYYVHAYFVFLLYEYFHVVVVMMVGFGDGGGRNL
jgi:hypothetical protein